MTLKDLKTTPFFTHSLCFHLYEVSPHPLLATKAGEKRKREMGGFGVLGMKRVEKFQGILTFGDEYYTQPEGNFKSKEM